MKNFLFLIGIALIVVSCNSGKNQRSTQTNDSSSSTRTASAQQATNEWTLNGYNKADAGTMVGYFLGKTVLGKPGPGPGVYDEHSRTNIWFSKDYIVNLYKLLNSKPEHANGFRIYFTRDLVDTSKYNIVIVSTRIDSTDRKHPFYQDYFSHSPALIKLINTQEAKGVVDHNFNGDISKGAILYGSKKCPNDNCKPADNLLSCKDDYAYVKNYNHTQLINTKSEHFRMDFLEDLVNELNSVTKTSKPDGVRIYYARKTKGNLRHHLVFMITEDVDNIHQDSFNCNYPPHQQPSTEFLNSLGTLKAALLGYDNGEQCEDRCTGTTAW